MGFEQELVVSGLGHRDTDAVLRSPIVEVDNHAANGAREISLWVFGPFERVPRTGLKPLLPRVFLRGTQASWGLLAFG